jgi:SAM-dependent methyltransferase
MAHPRTAVRDQRDFDTTSLRENHHGKAIHRDYTAHWHRWSFARRFIQLSDHVLEVGCGPERPLWRMMFRGSFQRCESYTGVDLNKLKPSDHQRSTFYPEFNFCADYKKIQRPPTGGFDVAVHMEVIEHMKVEHGRKLLKGCFELLRPGGVMLMSTPVYDGKRHAANHIHEYLVPELKREVEKVGFVVERRFGTFMDIKSIKKAAKESMTPGLPAYEAVMAVRDSLEAYYDNDALSCIFAPLFPDHARNNLWVCRKPVK